MLELGRLEAVPVLREARKVFVGLGARSAVEETDALIAHATAVSS